MSADGDNPIPGEGGTAPTGSGSGDTPIPGETISPTGKGGPEDSETLRTVQGGRIGEPTRILQESGERTVDLPLSEDD